MMEASIQFHLELGSEQLIFKVLDTVPNPPTTITHLPTLTLLS